jgi:hypothetical protein
VHRDMVVAALVMVAALVVVVELVVLRILPPCPAPPASCLSPLLIVYPPHCHSTHHPPMSSACEAGGGWCGGCGGCPLFHSSSLLSPCRLPSCRCRLGQVVWCCDMVVLGWVCMVTWCSTGMCQSLIMSILPPRKQKEYMLVSL